MQLCHGLRLPAPWGPEIAQANFWKLRASEQEGYLLQYAPLK
jgi:hypothetical protein